MITIPLFPHQQWERNSIGKTRLRASPSVPFCAFVPSSPGLCSSSVIRHIAACQHCASRKEEELHAPVKLLLLHDDVIQADPNNDRNGWENRKKCKRSNTRKKRMEKQEVQNEGKRANKKQVQQTKKLSQEYASSLLCSLLFMSTRFCLRMGEENRSNYCLQFF